MFAKKVAEKYPKYDHVELGGKSASDLQGELASHAAAEGLILENFPMDQQNVYDFNKNVSKVVIGASGFHVSVNRARHLGSID